MGSGSRLICNLRWTKTAISRKVVHATMLKGNMGYAQYTVPDIVAVENTFVVFL